jgi:hypothetical protein
MIGALNLSTASGVTGETAIVLVLVVAFVLWRQLSPQPYRPTRMLLWPVILVVLTVEGDGSHLLGSGHARLVIVVTLVFALVVGVVRGFVNQIQRRPDGTIWVMGGWIGAILYVVTLLLHYGLDALFNVGNETALVASLPLYLAALMVGRVIGLQLNTTPAHSPSQAKPGVGQPG